jgi:hypothetical protein
MNQISNELDYKSVEISHGTYALSRVSPQTPLATIPIGGGVESVFELSSRVMNLGRSILSFTTTPEATADKYQYQYLDGCSMIRSLQLYTRQGIYLCDINQLSKYMKMTMRRSHKVNDVINWDAAANGSAFFNGLKPNKGDAVTRPDGSALSSAVNEPAYLAVGAFGTATPVLSYQIPLARVVDSIVSMDRDQFYSDSVYLRIVWDSPANFISINTHATNPATAATGGPGAFAGTVGITNLTLFVAIEQDETISQALINKCKSNTLTYSVPYVYLNKININGAQQNLSTRYNLAHGRVLKRLLWSAFHNIETSSTAFDNSNVAANGARGSKITDYYTMLNNTRTSQFNYDVAAGLDYMTQKESLNGSCVCSSREFYYNRCHVEDFTGLPSVSASETLNVDSGYDLSSGELKYDIVAQCANANYNHYIYAVTTKHLTCSPTGVTIL